MFLLVVFLHIPTHLEGLVLFSRMSRYLWSRLKWLTLMSYKRKRISINTPQQVGSLAWQRSHSMFRSIITRLQEPNRTTGNWRITIISLCKTQKIPRPQRLGILETTKLGPCPSPNHEGRTPTMCLRWIRAPLSGMPWQIWIVGQYLLPRRPQLAFKGVPGVDKWCLNRHWINMGQCSH